MGPERKVDAAAPSERADYGAPALWAVLFIALALRIWSAEATSLWLDDFHSLHHARASNWSEFLASVRTDNHPPLFLALLRVTRSVFGESELVLRAPSIVFGLGAIVLVWCVMRRTADRRTSLTAALLLAVSSLHLEASAGVRMYALLALAVLGTIEAGTELLERGRGAWRLALWTVIGLHTHYHFVHATLVLSATALGLAFLHPAYRERRRALLSALGIAGLLSVPWYAFGFAEQLQHDLAPGGSAVSPMRLAQSMLHLVFHDVALHGPVWRVVFVASGALVVVASLLGAAHLVRRAKGRPALAALLVAGAFGLPAWTALAAALSTRAGFEWRYLCGAIAPFVMLAAVGGVSRELPLVRARQAATAFALVAALVLTSFNAAHPGHEDYRGAAQAIVADARPGDAVVAADWQPTIFPHSIGWEYYAGRQDVATQVPRALAFTDELALVAPHELASLTRVRCVLRSIPGQATMLRTLRAEFPREDARAFGRGVFLVTFSR